MSYGVSFVVPIYNKAPYLPGVLDAIYAQEGTFEREFIFIDDGSTDNSLNVLKHHTKSWTNVQIITQPNGGPMAATNKGIFAAKQPYLKLVDADDLLTNKATATLLHALEKYPKAVAAFGRSLSYTFPNTPNLSLEDITFSFTYIADALKRTLRNSPFNPTQSLIRTKVAQEIGGCDPRIYYSQDYSLTLRLAQRGGFVQTNALICYLPKDVPNRVSGNKGRELQQVTLACYSFLKEFPLTQRSLFQFAAHRCAGRAYKYQYRQHHASFFTKWHLHHLLSYLPFLPKKYCLWLIQESVQAFEPIS